MIHIYVDYQGSRSEETDSFMDTGADYQAKLDEVEAYAGKIDQIWCDVRTPNMTQ